MPAPTITTGLVTVPILTGPDPIARAGGARHDRGGRAEGYRAGRLGDTSTVPIRRPTVKTWRERGAVLRMVSVRHAPASAGEVRRQLGADLAEAGVAPAVVGDAALVLSELVGNAVRYGRPLPGDLLEVSWAVEDDCLRLRVSDGGGPSVPTRHQAGPEDVRGRGLTIVAALARDWGVEQSRDGSGSMSTVWVELPIKE